MKGIIFRSFLEMVETSFGFETADQIIEQSNLPSQGIYTNIGTYNYDELVQLIHQLHEQTNIPISDLIYTYGKYLFSILIKAHPTLVENYKTPFELIRSIENHIHVEVKKLYPDAELPTFEIIRETPGQIELIYISQRKLYILAKALIDETFVLFKQEHDIQTELLEDDGSKVKFLISSK